VEWDGAGVARAAQGPRHGVPLPSRPASPSNVVRTVANCENILHVDFVELACQNSPVAWSSFEADAAAGERTVLVVRHGRTSANEEGIHQNWGPYQLSSAGIVEIETAKRWWNRWTVTHYISSPVPRAIETANRLWGCLDELDGAWGERAVPAVEGSTLEEAHRLHPTLLEPDGWVTADSPTSPFVESSRALDSRVRAALVRAACTVPEEHVVAVMTHGAVLAAILSFSESVRPLRPTDVRCANLEVLEIAVDPTKGWSVRRRHSPLTFG
jgi:broad specificity phosphatase PhoE